MLNEDGNTVFFWKAHEFAFAMRQVGSKTSLLRTILPGSGSRVVLITGNPEKISFVVGNIAMGGWQSDGSDSNSMDGTSGRKKKRKSRWNTEVDEKTVIPGMPTVIPANLSQEQEKQYIIHLQIEEISRKLRSGDLGIPPNPEDRCDLLNTAPAYQ
ncbi:hypothetical protein BaRGS_00014314 [Batillaria attramentaria]|uniref:Splicing factor 1 helix-hairpin domain-containing protein n=1 Tax=Batillaria attramentaria TaxID=370345 RepID=A0ABD0L523_9CAEN